MATGLLRRIIIRRNGQIYWQLGPFATHYLHGDVPPIVKAKCELPELPSEKKQMLYEAMHGLENNINFVFTQLKVIYSNVNKSELFTRTFLDIEKSYKQPGLREVDSFASVFEKGINVLKRYLEDPENVPEDHEKKVALVRLIQTIFSCEGLYLSKSTVTESSFSDFLGVMDMGHGEIPKGKFLERIK